MICDIRNEGIVTDDARHPRLTLCSVLGAYWFGTSCFPEHHLSARVAEEVSLESAICPKMQGLGLGNLGEGIEET